jgi:UDP-N-acetylmuramoylalanine--D-glutamate ligase
LIPVRGFEGKTVAVFGLARTGLAAARALLAGGAEVAVWDERAQGLAAAQAEGLEIVDLSVAEWSRFDALMLSPGVPLTHPEPHWTVRKARQAGVEILGDIELFARTVNLAPAHKRPRIVAITGTNGKSTTTALIGWVLKQAGLTVHVGGNIGIGVLALPAPTPNAVYVIEVSSYQLDLTTGFSPDVAILTNISPDHLDRHGGMAGYVAAKARLFRALGPSAIALVGVDETESRQIAEGLAEQGVSGVRVFTSAHPGESRDPVLS